MIEATLALWQPQTTRRLTAEDAREMAENVAGFFQLLHEWDLADRRQHRKKGRQPQKNEEVSRKSAVLDTMAPK